MPLYYFYRVTHPQEPGCYAGYTRSVKWKSAWSVIKNNKRHDENKLGSILRKYPDNEFVIELLGVKEMDEETVRTYIKEVHKVCDATWNTDSSGTCTHCGRHFSNLFGLKIHADSQSCLKARSPLQILGF